LKSPKAARSVDSVISTINNMDNARTIKLLQELVDACRDGQNGYRDAADHVTDSHLREFFNEQSLARAGFAGELAQEIIRLGKANPDSTGSAAAGIRRAWMDFKSELGGGDATILASVESGEESAKEKFLEASQDANLPENLAALIRRQHASIAAAHDHIRSLRDAKAA
jgi:uncharacterized protein (TIGR02284 family)